MFGATAISANYRMPHMPQPQCTRTNLQYGRMAPVHPLLGFDVAVVGLNLPTGTNTESVIYHFLSLLRDAHLHAVPSDVLALVSHQPGYYERRGLIRLRLTPRLFSATLAASPRLAASARFSAVSISPWRTPEERAYHRSQQDVGRSEPWLAPRTDGRADASLSWRNATAGAPPDSLPLRAETTVLRPAIVPAAPPTAQRRRTPPGSATTAPRAPQPPRPVAVATTTTRNAAAHASAPSAIAASSAAHTAPASAPSTIAAPFPAHAALASASAPSSIAAPSSPHAAPPVPPPGEQEDVAGPSHIPDLYIVEEFCAKRRVQSYRQYLVKWSGYHMVGEEAAYTWQWAKTLKEDLIPDFYRKLVRELRQRQQGSGLEGSSTYTSSQESGAEGGVEVSV